jgi:hypothetical protein
MPAKSSQGIGVSPMIEFILPAVEISNESSLMRGIINQENKQEKENKEK